MVVMPASKPETEKAEHPRGVPEWITPYPSLAQINGKPPIDEPPVVVSRGGPAFVHGKQPGARGLPEEPTSPNTLGSSH
jgi:hypothetical protein